MKRRTILGLDADLLTIVAIFFAAVAFMWLFISCGLITSAQESAQQAGAAAEQIGDTIESVGTTVNWAISALVGYVLGELRRPVMAAGKNILKNGSLKSPGNRAPSSRVQGK